MKILYICTHNRARSILCEALTNHLGSNKLVARSAGSQPAGAVHPKSLFFLTEAGVSTEGLRSKSWDELEAFAPDLVITVCDSAAGESCPLWFGSAVKVHWGLADPSKVEGTDEEQAAAFRTTIEEIRTRIKALQTLEINPHDKAALRTAMIALGAQA